MAANAKPSRFPGDDKGRRVFYGYATSTPRNNSGLHRVAVLGDLARAREPDAVLALVLHAVADRLPQRTQSERLADDEPMQRQREDERLMLRLLQHFLELIDDHVGELAPGMVARGKRAGIVEFYRIRN